ncbi:hypothetical protein [Siccirubricoccus phaeus]|uniref:hypothetical protein n=1 Tax=Siccirubricoccus phaeus TaxID=2595053 RepID=UPI0011F131A0|nr:hypothetical protein [Siccirubricoccus phaeus]
MPAPETTALPLHRSPRQRGLLRRLRWWWLRRQSAAILRRIAAEHRRPGPGPAAEPGWERRLLIIAPGFGVLRLSR